VCVCVCGVCVWCVCVCVLVWNVRVSDFINSALLKCFVI